MTTALIGHTGFVGGNLKRQTTFDELFHSKNIGSIEGRAYQLVVCAGAPAVKWKANKEPEADWANLQVLIQAIEKVKAEHFVLISTVDVYPQPVDVDESTPIDRDALTPYGKHRLMLEDVVRDRFDHTVLRLPGLFGPGIKKNIIYDFLNNNAVDMIAPSSVFQFYNLDHLWADIERIRRADISVINMATEPTSVASIAREAFGFEFANSHDPKAARYDFRTRFDQRLGGHDGYLYDQLQVLAEMRSFVEDAGWVRPEAAE